MKNLFIFLWFAFGLQQQSLGAVNIIITGASVPNSMLRGQTYSISYTVKNTGTTSTSTSFWVNVSINSSAGYGGHTYLTDLFVSGGLSAGSSKTVSGTITIPCSYSSGTKYILGGADATNLIVESNESDNNFTPLSTLIQSNIDLIPLNYSLSNSTVNAGNSLTTFFAVNNAGATSAGSFNVGFYLSASPTLVVSQSVFLGNYPVSSVSGCAQTISLNKTLAIPSSTCTGTYYLFLWVDNGQVITESSDNNNFQSQIISISGNGSPPIPTSLVATNPTNNSIQLSWANSTGATNYTVYYSSSACLGSGLAQVTATSSPFVINGLSPSTTYYFNVTASNNCGTSSYSNCTSNTTLSNCTTPANPSNPTSNSPQCGSVVITRNGTVPANQIWYWQNSCSGTSTAIGAGSTFTASTSGTYYLRAFNTVGGCWSNGCGSVTVSILPSPTFPFPSSTNATCFGCSNGIITVNGASGGVGPYQYSKNGGINWQSSNVFTGLATGSYTVVVKDANNCSSAPQIVFISQPAQPTMPPVISGINISPQNNVSSGTTVTLSATASNGPSSWNWTVKGGMPYVVLTSTSANPSFPLVSLGSYSVTLQTANVAGTSSPFITSANFITVKQTATAQAKPALDNAISNGQSLRAAEPVNTATGSYEYVHTDLRVSAVNTSLSFTRYYNSVNNTLNSPLGYGWSHTYDCYISNQSDTLWTVHYGDGHAGYFIPYYNGNGTSFSLYGGTYETLTKDLGTGKFSLTFKNKNVYSFNTSGKLATITDLSGNVTTLNYDTNGNLISVVAPGGRKLFFNYSSSYLVSVTDELPRSVKFGYDISGNLTSVVNADSGINYFTYYTPHLIKSIVNPSGDTLLTNIYDVQNRVITQWDAVRQPTTFNYSSGTGSVAIIYPGGDSIVAIHDTFYRLTNHRNELGFNKAFTYEMNNNPISVTDENNHTTVNVYDSIGNVLEIQQPQSTNTTFNYDQNNDITSIKNALGDSIRFLYYSNGSLKDIILPGNSGIHYAYYSNGLLQTLTDALGNNTAYTYNSYGDVLSVTTTAGVKRFIYDTVGRITSYENESHFITKFSYDKKDRIIKIEDPLHYTVTTAFDKNDNLLFVKDKNGNTASFLYDNKDRLIDILRPHNSRIHLTYDLRDNVETVKDGNENIVTYDWDAHNRLKSILKDIGSQYFFYDSVGNNTRIKNADNYEKHLAFDPLNRLASYKDELQNTTDVTYDKLNHIKSIKDPMLRTTLYDYDALGYLKNVKDNANVNTIPAFDANGNLRTLKDPNGFNQSFSCNSSGQLTKHIDAEGKIDSLQYDGTGNVIKIIKPTGTIFINYDSAGRVQSINNSIGDNYNYTRDGNGNILSMHNNAGTAYFKYDSLNRLVRHIDVFGDTVSYTYDSMSNRTSVIYPGNRKVTYKYNSSNLLERLTDWQGNITRYEYYPTGRLKSQINPFSDTCKYIYDNAGRLISLTHAIGNTIIAGNTLYLNKASQKDSILVKGAVTSHLPETSYAYTYLTNDVLSSDGKTTYGNDNSGNRTSGGGTYQFTVDDLLTSFNNTSFGYDAIGNRIYRNENGNYTRYLLDLSGDLSQVLQERDSTGKLKSSYIWGLGLVARIDSAGKILYYHFDAQHNTTVITNDSGKITDTYTYELFGKLIKHKGNTNQPFTFLGQYGIQRESDSFYYIRARYYDANTRFISKDKYPVQLLDPQTIDRYVYGLNDPISYFDITGLAACSDKVSQPPSLYDDPRRWFEFEKETTLYSFQSSFNVVGNGFVNAWDKLVAKTTDPNTYIESLGLAFGIASGEVILAKLLRPAYVIEDAALANRLKHIFDNVGHNLDDLVVKFGSKEEAFNAVQRAANIALREGKLLPSVEGVLPSPGAILNVEGINVRLIGGLVKNGEVIISSFSRLGL